jgi:hypothetical protein
MKPVTTKDYDLYKIRLDAVLTRTLQLFREHDRRKADERRKRRADAKTPRN